MTRGRKYRLLMVLCGTQFLTLGFVYHALVAVLRREGASLEQLGAIQLIGLVWVVKFLWAPLVDRYGSTRLGHYRGWLMGLQLSMGVCVLLLIPFEPPEGTQLLILGIVALSVLSSTQDIAVDGLAVRLLSPAERGPGNGVQRAGTAAGYLLGAGGVLIVYDWFGWVPALLLLATLNVLPLLLVVPLREPAVGGREPARPSPRSLFTFYRQPGAARWTLLVMPLSHTGIVVATVLVTPILVDAGWSLAAVGTLSAIWGSTVAVGGALLMGGLVNRFGRRGAILLLAFVQTGGVLALLPLVGGTTLPVVLAALAALNLSYAAGGTLIATVIMDHSRASSAGSDVTMQTSFAFLCSQLAAAGGLALAGTAGYAAVLAGAAVLTLGGGLAATWLFRPHPTTTQNTHGRARDTEPNVTTG